MDIDICMYRVMQICVCWAAFVRFYSNIYFLSQIIANAVGHSLWPYTEMQNCSLKLINSEFLKWRI